MVVPQFVSTGASIFPATLFVLLFLCASIGLGRRALLLLGVPRDGPLMERVLVSLAIGAGVFELLPIFLAAFRALSVSNLRITVALAACVALPDFLATVRQAAARVRTTRRPIPGWLVGWGIASLPALLVIFFTAITPAVDPDGLGYHLTVPKYWLSTGTLSFMPMYIMSNMPMGGEMLFAIGLSFVGDTGAKLLHFSLGLAGAATLVVAGRRIHSTLVGVAAATLFLFGPFGIGTILGSAYIEGIQGFFVVASLAAWLVWYSARQEGWLRAAFLVAGFAVSIKITSAMFPAGLLLVTWFVLQRERPGAFSPAVILGTWPMMLLVAAPVIPWLIREALVVGNPVFPMFSKLFPTREFPQEVASEWGTYFRYMNWGNSLGPDVSLETRKLVIFIAAGIVLAGTGVVYALLRSPTARATAVVSGLLAVIQVFAVGLYRRHWVAVLAVIQLLVIAQFIWILPARILRAGVVAMALALSLLVAHDTLGKFNYDYAGLVRTAFGIDTQRDFLARHLPPYPLFEHVNRYLPANSGVLLEFSCGGFLLDRRTFCLENPQGAINADSWETFVDDARRLGVTHVIAPQWMADSKVQQFGDMVRSGPGVELRGKVDRMLIRLLRTQGQLLASASDLGLYAVDLPAIAAAQPQP